jgi:hypothetical protein
VLILYLKELDDIDNEPAEIFLLHELETRASST